MNYIVLIYLQDRCVFSVVTLGIRLLTTTVRLILLGCGIFRCFWIMELILLEFLLDRNCHRWE